MKLQPLPTKKVIQTLELLGFAKIRQRGSHVFFRHPDGRTLSSRFIKGNISGEAYFKRSSKIQN